MSSKQTGGGRKKIALENYLPESVARKTLTPEPPPEETGLSGPDGEELSGQPDTAGNWNVNDLVDTVDTARLESSIGADNTALPKNGIDSAESMETRPPEQPERSDNRRESTDSPDSADSLQTEPTESPATAQQAVQTAPRRPTGKQRKESLEEYRQTFLTVPKLEDRKPVFVSREVRDRLDEIARKLGDRRMSVSGFIENLARHHLAAYHEDIEVWRKL